MPTQYDMPIGADLYRGILEYEYTPASWQIDPNNPRGRRIHVPTGPEETRQLVIGPFLSVTPIKAYITRNRSRNKNLRIKRVEKVTAWEEVEDF